MQRWFLRYEEILNDNNKEKENSLPPKEFHKLLLDDSTNQNVIKQNKISSVSGK